MSTAFGIKSNCIEEPNNEYRIQGKKIFETNSFWISLFMFVPQVMNFFSIPLTERSVTKFYMNMFRENVEYRQAHNITRYDFMNLLIQLMEKGYVEPDDDQKTNISCKYICFISIFILIASHIYRVSDKSLTKRSR